MKDTIYLILDSGRVDRMVKSQRSATNLYKGEIAVRLKIEVSDDHFSKPFLEKSIQVEPWDKGIDVNDVHFEGDFVTEQEAEMIRAHRLEKMKSILEDQGYSILSPNEDDKVEQ